MSHVFVLIVRKLFSILNMLKYFKCTTFKQNICVNINSIRLISQKLKRVLTSALELQYKKRKELEDAHIRAYKVAYSNSS